MKTQKLILCIVLVGAACILLLTCIGNALAGGPTVVPYVVDNAGVDGCIQARKSWYGKNPCYTHDYLISEMAVNADATSGTFRVGHLVSPDPVGQTQWFDIDLYRGYVSFDLDNPLGFQELEDPVSLVKAELDLTYAGSRTYNSDYMCSILVYPGFWGDTLTTGDWGNWNGGGAISDPYSIESSRLNSGDIKLVPSGLTFGQINYLVVITSREIVSGSVLPDRARFRVWDYEWIDFYSVEAGQSLRPKLTLWYMPHTITGRIEEHDAAGNAIPATNSIVTIMADWLEATPGSPTPRSSKVVTTDGNGDYSFEALNADFGVYTIDGYVKRPSGEGINGVDVTVTGGSSPINLITTNGPIGEPGYYVTHVGYMGSRQYTVTPSNPPLSPTVFYADTTAGFTPFLVDFTGRSSDWDTISWDWDFGDGGKSTAQNPSHIYNISGTYTVSLKATGPGGDDTHTKVDYITVTPFIDFSADVNVGQVPHTVNFTGTSTGLITGWSWDFNDDGIEDSTVQNPVYTYNNVGDYTVSLTVTDPGGSATKIKENYIKVTPPPVLYHTPTINPFDGTESIVIPSSPETSGGHDLTVEVSFTVADVLPGWKALVAKDYNDGEPYLGGDWGLYIDGNQQLVFFGHTEMPNANFRGQTILQPNTEYHAAFTYDHATQTLKLYLNEQPETLTGWNGQIALDCKSVVLDIPLSGTTLPVQIGKSAIGIGYTGDIHYVAIFNSVWR